MTLTNQDKNNRRKERYHSDPEFRKRAIDSAKRYHANKRQTDPEYLRKRSEYNKANAAYFNKKQKQYNGERPFNYAFRRLRLRAKQNNIPFDLDEAYLVDLWTGKCAIFNSPLCLPYSTKHQDPNKATIDKIIPELGYVKGNIQWVSNKANIIKSFGTLADHEAIVSYLKYHIPKLNRE